tara:strand:+ start:7346 stop:7567 length:222 start_codon:yes stop_codon:yes gene_type:complete
MKLIFLRFFQAIIIFYQKVCSPLLISRCRFIPTCSQYGLDAIEKYGPWKGFFLTVKRVFNCHPWGGSGHDPVP